MNTPILKLSMDQNNSPLTDKYDIAKETMEVHGPVNKYITKDLILSHLTDKLLDNKTFKYVRDQIKLCLVIETQIKYTPTANEITKFLMAEVHSMVAMSRAVDGKIITAVLEMLKQDIQIENEQNTNTLTQNKPTETKT